MTQIQVESEPPRLDGGSMPSIRAFMEALGYEVVDLSEETLKNGSLGSGPVFAAGEEDNSRAPANPASESDPPQLWYPAVRAFDVDDQITMDSGKL